jgi:hypothetical protein
VRLQQTATSLIAGRAHDESEIDQRRFLGYALLFPVCDVLSFASARRLARHGACPASCSHWLGDIATGTNDRFVRNKWTWHLKVKLSRL